MISRELKAARAEIAALEEQRRQAHEVLTSAGVRSYQFLGDDPRYPSGRRLNLVERIELLVITIQDSQSR